MNKICKKCGELREHHARGLCGKCYMSLFRIRHFPAKRICKKCGELREHHARGLCGKCYNKKWGKENPDKVREINKKSYTKDKANKANKKWRKKNPDRIREYHCKRRANGIIRKGTISKLLNENVFRYGAMVCEACEENCEENYHVDHIKPISKGGTNDYDNLQILCAKCNLKKHIQEIRYVQDFKEKQLFLRGRN